MKTADWLVRAAMLVLSCLATLALIGSLSTMSAGGPGDSVRGRGVAMVAGGETGSTTRPPAVASRAAQSAADGPAGAPHGIPPDRGAAQAADHARWMKALTYAVLAVAGFVAAGVVALGRIAFHLGRIAGR